MQITGGGGLLEMPRWHIGVGVNGPLRAGRAVQADAPLIREDSTNYVTTASVEPLGRMCGFWRVRCADTHSGWFGIQMGEPTDRSFIAVHRHGGFSYRIRDYDGKLILPPVRGHPSVPAFEQAGAIISFHCDVEHETVAIDVDGRLALTLSGVPNLAAWHPFATTLGSISLC
jgi:hypothetical protein